MTTVPTGGRQLRGLVLAFREFAVGLALALSRGISLLLSLPVMVVGGRAYVPDDATARYLAQRTGPALRLYARQMGVSPSLVDVANDVPHTTVRNLSSSELARYSLVTQRRSPRAVTKHQTRHRQRARR